MNLLDCALYRTLTTHHTVVGMPNLFTHLHTKNGLAVALQGSEQEPVPCITDTNGTVIRSYDQQFAGTFLSCGETAHCPRAMAFEDLLLLVVLKNKPTFYKTNLARKPQKHLTKTATNSHLLPTLNPECSNPWRASSNYLGTSFP